MNEDPRRLGAILARVRRELRGIGVDMTRRELRAIDPHAGESEAERIRRAIRRLGGTP